LFGFVLNFRAVFTDTDAMTLPLFGRRPRVATRPRRRILDVTNHWNVAGPVPLREVLVHDYDGRRRRIYLPDEHPAVVAWIARHYPPAAAA
jgi:hypothetical protein